MVSLDFDCDLLLCHRRFADYRRWMVADVHRLQQSRIHVNCRGNGEVDAHCLHSPTTAAGNHQLEACDPTSNARTEGKRG